MPVPLERSGAGTWIGQQLATLPGGVTTVVFHSIVWPYLSGDERAAVDHAVRAAGVRADSDHRLAWVSLEPDRSGICLTCELAGERTAGARDVKPSRDKRGMAARPHQQITPRLKEPQHVVVAP